MDDYTSGYVCINNGITTALIELLQLNARFLTFVIDWCFWVKQQAFSCARACTNRYVHGRASVHRWAVQYTRMHLLLWSYQSLWSERCLRYGQWFAFVDNPGSCLDYCPMIRFAPRDFGVCSCKRLACTSCCSCSGALISNVHELARIPGGNSSIRCAHNNFVVNWGSPSRMMNCNDAIVAFNDAAYK